MRNNTLTIITLNLDRDGGPDDHNGQPPAAWRQAHELLAEHEADLVLQQEATYSHLRNYARLHAAEALHGGTRGFLSPNGHASHNPNALFIREAPFKVTGHRDPDFTFRVPPTVITAELRTAPGRRITIASHHGAFQSRSLRRVEAESLSEIADQMKKDSAVIIGGDMNEEPWPEGEMVPPTDWTTVTDRPFLVHRAEPDGAGGHTSITYTDQVLLTCGLHDVARYAATHLGQRSALAPTAGHAATPGQGASRRIDRIYLDPWLIQAVMHVEVIDTSAITDHHAVKAVLNADTAAHAVRRDFEPLPPLL